MTLTFIKQINEYVIEATIEASDEEIFACVGSDGYPSQQDIHQARAVITRAVKEQRQYRLSQQKAAEIERLNAIIRFAAGYISTTDGWTDRHPQECFDWLMEQTGEVES
jgi:hypothetical protein